MLLFVAVDGAVISGRAKLTHKHIQMNGDERFLILMLDLWVLGSFRNGINARITECWQKSCDFVTLEWMESSWVRMTCDHSRESHSVTLLHKINLSHWKIPEMKQKEILCCASSRSTGTRSPALKRQHYLTSCCVVHVEPHHYSSKCNIVSFWLALLLSNVPLCSAAFIFSTLLISPSVWKVNSHFTFVLLSYWFYSPAGWNTVFGGSLLYT